MSIWALLQIVCNLAFFAVLFVFWLRLKRPPQDDPRLSRGLQLLQTKITVLEDLSDRTDNQVKQLTALLDQKTRMLQNKVLEAEQTMLKIDHSMHKSLEVAEIFQDKIPHQEIMERQQKVEYVRAARMAHSGLSVDDIAEQVSLPREQIELIAKFNREQLMFDEDRLPEWASRATEADEGAGGFTLTNVDFIANLEQPKTDFGAIARIESEFKSAIASAKEQEAIHNQTLMESKVAEHLRATVANGVQSMQPAVMSMRATAQTLKEKLVSTAEDLLRAQQAPPAARPADATNGFAAPAPMTTASVASTTVTAGSSVRAQSGFGGLKPAELEHVLTSTPSVRKVEASARPSTVIRAEAPPVKKVIFPRIER